MPGQRHCLIAQLPVRQSLQQLALARVEIHAVFAARSMIQGFVQRAECPGWRELRAAVRGYDIRHRRSKITHLVYGVSHSGAVAPDPYDTATLRPAGWPYRHALFLLVHNW